MKLGTVLIVLGGILSATTLKRFQTGYRRTLTEIYQDAKAIVLELSPSHSGAILHNFFPQDWNGEVQTDGAAMYPGAFKHFPNLTRFECIGHLHRYAREAVEAGEEPCMSRLAAATTKSATGLLPHDYLVLSRS